MNKKNLVDWINKLIAEDRLSDFYTSRPWRKARAISFEQNNYECQECKRNGKLTLLAHPGQQPRAGEVKGIGHHKKPVRKYPQLALTVSNIEPVCWSCHNKIEKENTENILTEEIW